MSQPIVSHIIGVTCRATKEYILIIIIIPIPTIDTTDIKMSPSEALISEGRKIPEVRFYEGQVHPLLMQLTSEQAQFMADHQRQGHQNFQRRYDVIKEILGLRSTEICAESWERQKNDPIEEIAKDAYRSWSFSEGHWAVCIAPHKYYGCDICQGKNGIWYSCVLVGDAPNPQK